MDIEHGIALGVIGCILTLVGFGIALHIGSKENKEVKYEDLTSVQKSLVDLQDKRK